MEGKKFEQKKVGEIETKKQEVEKLQTNVEKLQEIVEKIKTKTTEGIKENVERFKELSEEKKKLKQTIVNVIDFAIMGSGTVTAVYGAYIAKDPTIVVVGLGANMAAVGARIRAGVQKKIDEMK